MLTSAWRLSAETLAAVIRVLFESGIWLGGCTPDLGVDGMGDHVDEIHAWLNFEEVRNNVRGYLQSVP